MFRESQCSSSGVRILLIHNLVWFVCLSDCLVCRSGGFPSDRHTKQSLTHTNHIRWGINTIRSPDDQHCDARNMYREKINKYMKKCVELVIIKTMWLPYRVMISTRGCWQVLSSTSKKTSYSDQTRYLFNILPTKLNTHTRLTGHNMQP